MTESRTFTIDDRERLLATLVEAARNDHRITGVALVGSASIGAEDRWSDIDLSFSVRSEAEIQEVLGHFADLIQRESDVVDTLDSPQGQWRQRIFLLANTLQIDLAFTTQTQFGAQGPTFKLLFGTAMATRPISPPDTSKLIAEGWLYALHLRSSFARKKWWQAEFMLSAMRDQALALACVRHGLAYREGRGLDALPEELRQQYERTLLRSLDQDNLLRSFRATCDLLLDEVRVFRPDLTERLEGMFRLLGESVA